ncbi:hypothetical protein [Parafrigoribacterium soli]|uniref:hypothetical protein n=1 Tax=Parafrigoribacterium soli TaxID=3144663 RepID=UPI0032F03E6B
MTEATPVRDGNSTRERVGSSFIAFGVGILAGALGILPWLIGGGTLPLQNLWVADTMPHDMPFALLPVSQYEATTIFVLLLMGGVFAGLAVHVIARRRSFAAWPAALGLFVVQVVAVVQSYTVVSNGLGLTDSLDRRTFVYFAGMLGGAIVALVVAQAAFWIASRRAIGPVALAIGLAAVPFAAWLSEAARSLIGPSGIPMPALTVLHWLPAVVAAAALVWCGLRPPRRIAVWVAVLAGVWVIPALFTTIQYGLGMRVLQGDLREMASASGQVLPLALGEQFAPTLVALALAVVGTAIVEFVRRRNSTAVTAPTPVP